MSSLRKFYYYPVVAEGDRFVDAATWSPEFMLAEVPLLDRTLKQFYRAIKGCAEIRGKTFTTTVFQPVEGNGDCYIIADEDGSPPESGDIKPLFSQWLSTYAEDIADKCNYSEGWAKGQSAYLPSEFLRPVLTKVTSTSFRAEGRISWEELIIKKRLVIMGPPGAGKTSCLRRFTLERAERLAHSPNSESIPIYLQPRNWTSAEDARREIEAAWVSVSTNPTTSSREHRLEASRLLLICDGLDEVPDIARHGVHQFLIALINEHPELGMIIATRAAVYRGEFKFFTHVWIEPFTSSQMDEWSYKRLYSSDLRHWSTFSRHLAEVPKLKELASSPFLLGLLTHLYATSAQLPKDASTIMSSYLRAMLSEWDMVRGITRFERPVAPAPQMLATLCRVALWMLDSKKTSFTTTAFCDLQEALFDHETALLMLPALAETSGILSKDDEKPDLWRFSHPAWTPFLAAYHLVERPDDATKSLRLTGDLVRWGEVWYHACGLSQDAAPLVKALLRTRSIPLISKAILICNAFSQNVQIDSETARRGTEIIFGALEGRLKGFEVHQDSHSGESSAPLWKVRLIGKSRTKVRNPSQRREIYQLIAAIYGARGGILPKILCTEVIQQRYLLAKSFSDALEVEGRLSVIEYRSSPNIDIEIAAADTLKTRSGSLNRFLDQIIHVEIRQRLQRRKGLNRAPGEDST